MPDPTTTDPTTTDTAPDDTAPDDVVSLRGVVKTYGERRTLDGLDLELRAGRWTGLVGPNGAGKTTTMLALAGLVDVDAGSVELFGRSVRGPRPDAVGWVPQEIALYRQLTARENLRAFGELHGLSRSEAKERSDEALRWIGLEERADERLAAYSGGMRRRVNIAAAVLHRPRLLLLDEPTVGVDPQARARIFAMLEELRDDGVAILHSSHELDDVETVCDELVVMDAGRAVARGAVGELVRRTVGEGARVCLRLEDLDGVEGAPPGLERDSGGRWITDLADPVEELPRLLEEIRRRGGRVLGLDLRRPGLREVFLELTGRDLRE